MIRRLILVTGAALLAMPAAYAGVLAQEIVQPLPPPGTDQLNSALKRLATNPRDVGALVDAGDAALKVGDVEGAMGFFGRARDIAPDNPRVKTGMATAFVRTRRPVEALRLYAEAEAAGADKAAMAADRGLAFDLVGDAASAQQNYRLALTRSNDPELSRRLALSQAIAGDRAGFEATLLPLLQKRDLAAYRTRAMGLAVLGDVDAAVKIAKDMMHADMAARMTPYLRTMPNLTQAQQAAAGNLGIFPRGATLASAGAVRPATPSAARPEARSTPAPASARMTPARPITPVPSETRRTVQTAQAIRDERLAEVEQTASSGSVELPPVSASKTTPAPTLTPAPAATLPVATPKPPASPPVIVARAPDPAPAQTIEPGLTGTTAVAPQVAVVKPTPPPAVAPQPVEEISLEDAFASFLQPDASAPSPSAGAVDITKIRIPREMAKPEPAPEAKKEPVVKPEPKKPPKPVHPAREWVQVATGKSLDALKFDWRRIAKKAGGKLDKKGPFTTRWVEANRLLTGPYDSPAAAKEMVKQLKAMGIDSFTFTSAAGEEIKPLK